MTAIFRRSKNMYKEIGGQEVIDKLVDDFYGVMSTDPKARECFETHAGKNLEETAKKLKFFLSGWTGGPQLYLENYGHPRLRMRHSPFKTGLLEGEQWLYCMDKALKKSTIPFEYQEHLMKAFSQVVDMLKK